MPPAIPLARQQPNDNPVQEDEETENQTVVTENNIIALLVGLLLFTANHNIAENGLQIRHGQEEEEEEEEDDVFYETRCTTLSVAEFIPQLSNAEKANVRCQLKQAFFSKSAVVFLALHFGSVDLCLAYMGIGLPGALMLVYDYENTLKSLNGVASKITTPVILLALVLMSVCYGFDFGDSLHHNLHQILSLLSNVHGILRLKESFIPMLSYFGCVKDCKLASRWIKMAYFCMFVCIWVSAQNLYAQDWNNGQVLIDYDQKLRIFFHIFRVTLLLAVVGCIFDDGLRAGKMIHSHNGCDRSTIEVKATAVKYTIEVLESRVWEEKFCDVYFLFAHLI